MRFGQLRRVGSEKHSFLLFARHDAFRFAIPCIYALVEEKETIRLGCRIDPLGSLLVQHLVAAILHANIAAVVYVCELRVFCQVRMWGGRRFLAD